MPAYNHEKFVQETIRSVIGQTYQNVELLILDDGSKDQTFEKVLQLQDVCRKRFIRVDFSNQSNKGTAKTLLTLINKSQGEYIYVIASDDLAKPDSVRKQREFLNQNPDYSLAVGDNEIIDADGKIVFWDKDRNAVYDKNKAVYKTYGVWLKQNSSYFDFNSPDFGLYKNLIRTNSVPNGYLIRKSIFQQTGLFPENPQILEDWWLMMQISKYAKMKYIDEILFSYRWHASNTIKNKKRIHSLVKNTFVYEIESFDKIKDKDVKAEVLSGFEQVRKRKKIFDFGFFSVYKIKRVIRKEMEIKLFGKIFVFCCNNMRK
jgi:alpha-1,3-rhamnosyltransferase